MNSQSMNLLYKIGERTFFNRTLLQHIKQGNSTEILSMLQDVDPCQLKDSTGTTLLHYAAKYGNTKFAQYLINSGININAETEAQVTALIIAVENNREEIVNLLFKSYVKIIIPKNNDQYTLKLALQVLEITIKAGYNYNRCESLVYKILVYGDKQIVREALPCILELYAKSLPIGEHVLEPQFYLSMNQKPNILEELRNYDFDVNAHSNYGSTMLHNAVPVGNASSVKFLLDRGANINALDASSRTPLTTSIDFVYCCHMCFEDDTISSILNCVDIILEHDADPQIIPWNFLYSIMDMFEGKYGGKILMIFESIITRVALRELQDHEVALSTLKEIQSVPLFQSIFSQNKLHLEEIKDIYISKNVSLLDFFTEKDTNISRYALNKRLVFNLNEKLSNYKSESCCHRKLRERRSKLNDWVNLRAKVATGLNEILTEICGISIYNIAEKVINYVSDDNLYKMI